MEILKEYAGVITAWVTVAAALGALGLWAINAQVTPEINRLEARIDVHETLLRRIDRKLDASIADQKERFELIDKRFERIDGELKVIRNDIKTILLRLPKTAEAG
ncbi:MAG: hypothetical protein OXK20_00245 [Deltaproteobacteria bacterium]|nr:hypothetical protein [Deltaproteobacteria bacterium]